MNFARLWTIFVARNYEYFRDRSALSWNFLFPFLIIIGFSIIFGDREVSEYKVGVFPAESEYISVKNIQIPEQFKQTKYVQFIGISNREDGMKKLKHHKIDFLIQAGNPPYDYWITNDSPKGYIVEKLFLASQVDTSVTGKAQKQEIEGIQIRYVEWLFPGILAMNMMFSALFGIGYVIVLYRKNGVLKRLKVTPLTALEYLSAQMLSRIFLLMFTNTVVWIGCNIFFTFKMHGSYALFFFVYLIGGLSLSSVGLVFASRGVSEEFTAGILNFVTWPMMFLSEVWFSLEGAPQWVKWVAKAFPLSYLTSAARKVMNDGAGLFDVATELIVLIGIAIFGLLIGSVLFTWTK